MVSIISSIYGLVGQLLALPVPGISLSFGGLICVLLVLATVGLIIRVIAGGDGNAKSN